MAVDENKRKIITAVETGGPYESEIEMLRKALEKLQPLKDGYTPYVFSIV